MSAKRKIVLKKLTSHDTIWHPESSLVFKSHNERLVIGRYDNNEIIPLDDEAMELCDEWNFKPDESLIQDNDEDQEDQEDQEEEEIADAKAKIEAKIEAKVESKKGSSEIVDVISTDYSILTKEYTESLLKTVVSIENIRSVLESLNQDKLSLISELTKTKEDLSISVVANKELQSKFDGMVSKFDTMRSLFS